MTRLTWTERPGGWQSGEYLIELAAPGLWVLTRPKQFRDPVKPARIVATSGSLSALKEKAASMEESRSHRIRFGVRLLLFLASFLTLVLTSVLNAQWAPLAGLLAGVIGFWALLGGIDSLISRSWESIRTNYQ